MLLWSLGTQILGMTSEEFWSLTLEEFDARLERHKEAEKRTDIRFGMFCSVYINSKLKQGARQYQPGEWFGHHKPEPEQSDDQMLAFMRAFSEAHNKQIANEG